MKHTLTVLAAAVLATGATALAASPALPVSAAGGMRFVDQV